MICLVSRFIKGGSLKSIIQADGSLPETSIRTIGVNICQGLYYLHQQEILFCDLNPEKVRKLIFTSFLIQLLLIIDCFRWFEYI